MMMKRIVTICLLVPNLWGTLLFIDQDVLYPLHAQTTTDLFPKLKETIGPSPQSAAFTRYGEYPVNYNTGLVDMKVPLYTITSGHLSLPIDISFHASGRMANETNGVLGMRWILNAGGVITRTVRGYADEWNDLTPYTANPSHTPNYDELRRSCKEGFIPWENYNPSYTKTDSEFDEFSYILPTGKSGRFVIKNDNGVKKAVQIPYEALKIEIVKDNSYYGYFGAITITDVDGTVYFYGNGTVYNSNYCEYNAESPIGVPGSIPTSWYLKKIVSSDKKDEIEFDYQRAYLLNASNTIIISAGDRVRDESVNANFHENDNFGSSLFYTLRTNPIDDPEYLTRYDRRYVPILNSIKFKGGELSFTYIQDYYKNSYALQSCTLNGTVHRKFNFNQELDSNEKELRYLKSLEIVSFSGNIEKVEEKYSFDYYRPATVGDTFALSYSTDKKDWWGYYNSSVLGLVPYRTIWLNVMESGNTFGITRNIGTAGTREPNFESKQLGMLKSITYPTGGKTVFEYENNFYKDGLLSKVGPGLRIKKVTNIPIVGSNVVKTYTYGTGEDGNGFLNPELKADKNTIQEISMMLYWDYPVEMFSGVSGNPTYFPEQAGYRIRDYSSDPFLNPNDFGGNIVWYDSVNENFETDSTLLNATSSGKIVYEFDSKNFDSKNFEITDTAYPYLDYKKVFADPYRLWKGGKLLNKTFYKKVGSSLLPTLKESYSYNDTQFEELWDMPVYRHVIMQDIRTAPDYSFTEHFYNLEKNYHNYNCSVFGYGYRKFVSGSEKISSKTVEHFDGAGISTTTNYFYDSQYDQLKKEQTTRSDGKQTRLEYDYPFDNTSLAVNTKMVGLNMLSTPLIKSHYVNGVFAQSQKTEYSEYYPDVIRPNKEFYKKNGAIEEPIILYNNYDSKGNPTEIQKANGIQVAYLWGYNQTLPVAKVENATQAQLTALNLNMALISDNGTSDSAMRTELQKIRTGLTDAMVTTYTYQPLVGVTSITYPKGDTVYYSYDGLGRLDTVKDAQGNILSKNEYHYKN